MGKSILDQKITVSGKTIVNIMRTNFSSPLSKEQCEAEMLFVWEAFLGTDGAKNIAQQQLSEIENDR